MTVLQYRGQRRYRYRSIRRGRYVKVVAVMALLILCAQYGGHFDGSYRLSFRSGFNLENAVAGIAFACVAVVALWALVEAAGLVVRMVGRVRQ